MRSRLVAVRAAAAVALVAVPLLGTAGPAAADAPQAAGWWNFATREGAPQPPSPPDVMAGDLLVQAGDPSGGLASGAAPAPSAVAAVRFPVPKGSSVGDLVLELGDGAVAMGVRAFPTKDPFRSELNAPLARAPKPDGTKSVLGVVDGTTLVFRGVASLLPAPGTLSLVLVPGPTDRAVLRKPGPDTLAVTAKGEGGSSIPGTSGSVAPPPGSGATGSGAPGSDPAGSGSAGSGAGGGGGSPAGGGNAGSGSDPSTGGGGGGAAPDSGTGNSGAPDVAGDPGLTGSTVPGGGAAAPDGAGQAPQTAPGPGTRVSQALPVDRLASDARTRYFALAEAVLVLVTFGLLGWGPFSRLAGLLGSSAAVPADAAAGSGPPVRGVGRFVRPRSGQAVRL